MYDVIMSCCVMSCYVMLCYIILCHVMLYIYIYIYIYIYRERDIPPKVSQDGMALAHASPELRADREVVTDGRGTPRPQPQTFSKFMFLMKFS